MTFMPRFFLKAHITRKKKSVYRKLQPSHSVLLQCCWELFSKNRTSLLWWVSHFVWQRVQTSRFCCSLCIGASSPRAVRLLVVPLDYLLQQFWSYLVRLFG